MDETLPIHTDSKKKQNSADITPYAQDVSSRRQDSHFN